MDASRGETLWIKVNASAAGVTVRLKGYGLTGELIKKGEFITTSPGWNQVEWDLKNDAGRVVGRGMYFIRVEYDGKAVIRKVYITK